MNPTIHHNNSEYRTIMKKKMKLRPLPLVPKPKVVVNYDGPKAPVIKLRWTMDDVRSQLCAKLGMLPVHQWAKMEARQFEGPKSVVSVECKFLRLRRKVFEAAVADLIVVKALHRPKSQGIGVIPVTYTHTGLYRGELPGFKYNLRVQKYKDCTLITIRMEG